MLEFPQNLPLPPSGFMPFHTWRWHFKGFLVWAVQPDWHFHHFFIQEYIIFAGFLYEMSDKMLKTGCSAYKCAYIFKETCRKYWNSAIFSYKIRAFLLQSCMRGPGRDHSGGNSHTRLFCLRDSLVWEGDISAAISHVIKKGAFDSPFPIKSYWHNQSAYKLIVPFIYFLIFK